MVHSGGGGCTCFTATAPIHVVVNVLRLQYLYLLGTWSAFSWDSSLLDTVQTRRLARILWDQAFNFGKCYHSLQASRLKTALHGGLENSLLSPLQGAVGTPIMNSGHLPRTRIPPPLFLIKCPILSSLHWSQWEGMPVPYALSQQGLYYRLGPS